MLRDFILVGIGGAMGSMARYAITLLSSYFAIASEIGTLTANALGSLLIGIIIALSKGDMNNNGDVGIPVPNYIEENVSTKVVKIIQSYTGVVNKMVWRKSE